MNTAGPQLTDEQIESQFKPLLARFMADLKATATDPDNLWALRRKMTKTLSYSPPESQAPEVCGAKRLLRAVLPSVASKWALCGA
jgi:hypothetical protein